MKAAPHPRGAAGSYPEQDREHSLSCRDAQKQEPELEATLLSIVRHGIFAEIDIEAAAVPGWYYRPFSRDEIEAHPDRERIMATIEAVVDDVLRSVKAQLADEISDLLGDENGAP
jgi:hypothetical protein